MALTPARPPEFRIARTCYDHLAGVLGVWLHDQLIEAGAIAPAERDHDPIEAGTRLGEVLASLGLEAPPRSKTRRAAYACRDLTERRHHLAGALGAQFCNAMLSAGWMERMDGTRALRVTALGRTELARRLGPLPALAAG